MPSYISYSFTGSSSARPMYRNCLILPCVFFMTDYSVINLNVYYCIVLLTINDDDDDIGGLYRNYYARYIISSNDRLYKLSLDNLSWTYDSP